MASDDRVRLFRSFDPLAPADPGPDDLDVPDPYYGGDDGFAEVIAMVERTCRALLTELESLPRPRCNCCNAELSPLNKPSTAHSASTTPRYSGLGGRVVHPHR